MVGEFEFLMLMVYGLVAATSSALLVNMYRRPSPAKEARHVTSKQESQKRKHRSLLRRGPKQSTEAKAPIVKQEPSIPASPPRPEFDLEGISRLTGIQVAILKAWVAEMRVHVKEEEGRKTLMRMLADLDKRKVEANLGKGAAVGARRSGRGSDGHERAAN